MLPPSQTPQRGPLWYNWYGIPAVFGPGFLVVSRGEIRYVFLRLAISTDFYCSAWRHFVRGIL